MPNAIDDMAAKGAGALGALWAKLKGLTGVFVTLAEQHQQVANLMSRAVVEEDPSERRDLWREIKKQLVSHEHAELGTVYAAVAEHERGAEIARRHADEAAALERIVSDIDVTAFDSPAWHRSMDQLLSVVKEHAAEEEGELFPRILALLGEQRAKELEEPFRRAQEDEAVRWG